ncbi:MAG TPA: glycosyltransferase family 4 protein [Bryobacteraceae bacterium]|nr:glycosyltransferase family 4 protein [Bryobacteraceae bacterium]
MLRTLHIDAGREMRGGQWQVLYLIRGLVEAGHSAILLARPGSPLLQMAQEQGLDAQPLRVASLQKWCRKADLIHAHDAHSHTLAVLSKRPLFVSRRVAFPVHGSFFSHWKYARPLIFLAVSKYVRGTLLAAGVPEEKIEVVYDGVPLPPEPEFKGRTRVLAMDSPDPRKGRSLIERTVKLSRVPVEFSSNLERDLADAQLFVYITDLEGLGSAALLAMAAGVPVLASRVGGLPEIVEDRCTGVLTENRPEEISTSLQRLIGDPELLLYLGRRARARVEERFTTSQMVQNTLRVYTKVLG